jgi:hypothetical protein
MKINYICIVVLLLTFISCRKISKQATEQEADQSEKFNKSKQVEEYKIEIIPHDINQIDSNLFDVTQEDIEKTNEMLEDIYKRNNNYNTSSQEK